MSITDTEERITKEADTDYSIHKLLQKRWSPRAFSDEPVDPDLIKQLFEAARWAPSSYNEQPWHFIVARQEDKEAFEKLSQVMNEFNRGWAKQAPVIALGLAETTFDIDGRPNPHAKHDLGQAIAHLTFEATRHDLYVHQMAGILPDKARELYNIDEDLEPTTMFAIGYRGEPEMLDEDLQEQEKGSRSRKPLKEVVSMDIS